MVELGRYLSVIAVLAGVILMPLIYRGTAVPAACRVWAGNRPALKDAAALKARAGDRKSRIAGLFKKVKLFCNSTSTLLDGSRDYHFIYMLIFNVSGLLAAIFIFFGGSARNFFQKRGAQDLRIDRSSPIHHTTLHTVIRQQDGSFRLK